MQIKYCFLGFIHLNCWTWKILKSVLIIFEVWLSDVLKFLTGFRTLNRKCRNLKTVFKICWLRMLWYQNLTVLGWKIYNLNTLRPERLKLGSWDNAGISSQFHFYSFQDFQISVFRLWKLWSHFSVFRTYRICKSDFRTVERDF